MTARVAWSCRRCGKHFRQKGDAGYFSNVVRRGRVVERWAEHGDCRRTPTAQPARRARP